MCMAYFTVSTTYNAAYTVNLIPTQHARSTCTSVSTALRRISPTRSCSYTWVSVATSSYQWTEPGGTNPSAYRLSILHLYSHCQLFWYLTFWNNYMKMTQSICKPRLNEWDIHSSVGTLSPNILILIIVSTVAFTTKGAHFLYQVLCEV